MSENKYKVETINATYSQDADSNSVSDMQFLEVSSEDAGGGTYYVIKTERWAFDTIQELIDTLTDFQSRCK
jgi:hypothetical protein